MLERQCSDLHKIFSRGWLALSSFSIFFFFFLNGGTSDNIYCSFATRYFSTASATGLSLALEICLTNVLVNIFTAQPSFKKRPQIRAKLIYFRHVSKTQLRNDCVSSQRSYVTKHVFSSRVKSFQETCWWVFWNLPGLLRQVCFHSNNRIHCHYC